MTLDDATAGRIGAAWLRNALAPVSDVGRRAEDAAVAYGPGDEAAAAAAIATVVALAAALDAAAVPRLRGALRGAPDAGPIAARARAGDPLDDVDLYELGRFADALDALAQAWDAAGGPATQRPPTLPSLAAELAPGRLPGGGFRLADAFGAELAPARARLASADDALGAARGALAQRVGAALGIAIDAEEFVVLRERHAGALPTAVRVVRETPAYRLCTLAFDDDAVALGAQRDEALARVLAAETAARCALAGRIAALGAAIAAATAGLGALDRTLARVALTQRFGGCVPDLAAPGIALAGATFPPLADALGADGRAYAPIDVAVEGVAVLTGPNMGGKTTALATLAFAALCAAAGMPPPAQRAAFPLFARIVWLGDAPAERASLLSSFGAEVVRARDLLAGGERPVLALVDEFARTTGPREGRALLIALVEALAARGIVALVATHLDGVAEAAAVPHLAVAGIDEAALAAIVTPDLRAALEAVGAAMDYRIVPAGGAAAPGADALALAGVLGLDPALVARARAVFGAPP